MTTIKKRGYAAKRQSEQQIVTIGHTISDYTSAHRKNLTIIGAVLAAALLLVGGYSLMRSMQEQKAAPLVAAAYEKYSPSGGANVDYTKALDQFRNAQKQYSSTLSGAIAQYYAGNCLMNLGRYDEALKEYQAFTSKYGSEKFLLGLVSERLGYLYTELGRQADAAKAFEQSESLVGPGVATQELAKLYETSGNNAEALKKYKLISDKLGGTSWAMEATGKVQKIAPTPPTAPFKEAK